MDALWTTLWVDGGPGPLTRGVTRLMRSTGRWAGHGTLRSVAGPAGLTLSVAMWLLLLWAGWALLFLSEPRSLQYTFGPARPGIMDSIYFAGYSLFTLGNGEIMPRGPFWQTATVVASASGMVFITLSITYLIRFLGAAVEKRSLASHLLGLAQDPVDLVVRAWRSGRFEGLDALLANVSPVLGKMAEQHLAYPMLHHYHSVRDINSPARAVAVLDEALTLLDHGVAPAARPEALPMQAAREAVQHHLRTLASAYIHPAREAPPTPSLERLRAAGIPVDPDGFRSALEGLDERRRLLLGLVEATGWTWPGLAQRAV